MGGLRIAVAGATGLVGRELLVLLESRRFPFRSLRLLASSRSEGIEIPGPGGPVIVEDLARADTSGLDLVFFCTGAETARVFAPSFAAAGAWVIDNSSAFRRDAEIPLVIPEINGSILKGHKNRLVSNPNCSTIIALLPLAALKRAFGLERVLLTTFQAVSGAGRAALEELKIQTRAAADGKVPLPAALPRPILHNLIPWVGEIEDSGFCREETKIAFESRKILGFPGLKISATTVRVPVLRCHSLSIWVRLARPAKIEEVRRVLFGAEGLVWEEDPPSPAALAGCDAVHVGRLRQDPDEDRAFWFWAVSDQLRKGAALNALQIAERIFSPADVPSGNTGGTGS